MTNNRPEKGGPARNNNSSIDRARSLLFEGMNFVKDSVVREGSRFLIEARGKFTVPGKRNDALQRYERALVLYRQSGHRKGEAMVLGAMAIVFRFKGNTELAERFSRDMLSIASEIEDPETLAKAHLYLGTALEARGDVEGAVRNYETARQILLQCPGGYVFEYSGDTPGDLADKMLTMVDIAREKERGSKREGTIKGIHEWKQDERKQHEREQVGFPGTGGSPGITGHRQRLGVRASDMGVRGITLLGGGNYYGALEHLELALDMHLASGDGHGVATDLGNMGLVYLKKEGPVEHLQETDMDIARDYIEKARGLAREIGDMELEAVQQANLGAVYRRLNDPRKALELYMNALALLDECGSNRGRDAIRQRMESIREELEASDRDALFRTRP